MNLTPSQRKRARLAYQWFAKCFKDLNRHIMTINIDHTGPQTAIGPEYKAHLQKWGRN